MRKNEGRRPIRSDIAEMVAWVAEDPCRRGIEFSVDGVRFGVIQTEGQLQNIFLAWSRSDQRSRESVVGLRVIELP